MEEVPEERRVNEEDHVRSTVKKINLVEGIQEKKPTFDVTMKTGVSQRVNNLKKLSERSAA